MARKRGVSKAKQGLSRQINYYFIVLALTPQTASLDKLCAPEYIFSTSSTYLAHRMQLS
jgi:hypothetical protein